MGIVEKKIPHLGEVRKYDFFVIVHLDYGTNETIARIG